MNEKINKIHDASMKILNKTGMRFHHPEILNLLKKNGVKIEGETAFFTENQILDWVGKAPDYFKVYARNPAHDFIIGDTNGVKHIEFAPGYGAPNILERSGKTRRAVLKDYIEFTKLVHRSDQFKVNGGILVEPSDINSQNNHAVMLYHVITLSDKFIFGMEGRKSQVDMTIDMVKILFGSQSELISKPRIMTIVNTLTPLRMDQTALDTILAYSSHGQPVIITPAASAGFTGPITLAGVIALSNAEALAGIAVTQMVRQGTPVVYGCQSTAGDMRTGAYVVGNPEHALCVRFASKLARHYGLPCRGGGAPSDAKQVSVQSGYESMMILLTCVKENINYIIHSAGIIDSFNCMSFDKFIIDLELLDMVKRIHQDVRVDDETLALDVIHQVGVGGEYMTSAHTAKLCRREIWSPDIGLKGPKAYENIDSAIFEKIERKKDKMLMEYQQPQLSDSVQSELVAYLKDNGVEERFLYAV
ncbi:MAG: trimethylamine methyltransferase family protein [Proteobacteria bacterium]|nr:trimethylamine methyltransferase family protein [Pseudomonadota bacterium]MBU1697753.1 trimethylamine methyltransferase family protein [Pseudomonadota bacterium]